MIIKFLILSLVSQVAIAWTPPESFNSTYIDLEDSIFEATIQGRYRNAKSSLTNSVIETIFKDKKNLIKKDFDIPKYFEPSVKFWFSIYTQYSSDQVVIHDSNNLKLVYNVIDFSELHNNASIHRFSKSKLQSHLSLEYTRRVKKILKDLTTKNLKKVNEEQDDVLRTIKSSGLKIPKNRKKRKKFFLKLANNIRTQTGQRNMVYQGITRSLPYLPYLSAQLKKFRLPKELVAISFLESSFNIVAKSKVDAVGIWQFMPYISNLFMPKISNYVDYRHNPIIASLSAFHLLKENKLILRRWDLAVPAYNSGPKHLKKAIKKFSKIKKKKDISLAYILTHYKHPHIGFASKNFYSEFLALTRVLAYKELIYPLKGVKAAVKFENETDIGIYVTKCSIVPQTYISLLENNSPKIGELNYHFLKKDRKFPRGTLVVSDKKLSTKKYYRVSDKQIKSRFPKNFHKLIKNKKCMR
jgi:membrane-bound lytic murein transglycosylase D